MYDLVNPCGQVDFPNRSAAYTGTAGNTATWNVGPQGVIVWSDQICYVEVGTGVVATSGSTLIPANTFVRFKVPLNVTGPWRVSAVQLSTGGTVYAKPINKE